MQVLGLDIGGAHIKAATADGAAQCVPFAIWKKPEELPNQLRQIGAALVSQPDIVALVMTAELADCFQSRDVGVEFIIQSVRTVFSNSIVRVWLTSGEFADPDDALQLCELVAASNWHALATWVGRAVPHGPALIVDIGSTTVDLIPLFDGVPQPEGLADLERLCNHELLYTGARRTPVCAMVPSVPLQIRDGEEIMVPVAGELFATALDVYLITGDVAERPLDTETADGRPATRFHAMNRLAHMVCCDSSQLSEDQLLRIAGYVATKQINQITDAIENRLDYLDQLTAASASSNEAANESASANESSVLPRILVCGSGAWLAEKALEPIDDSQHSGISSLVEMFVRNVSDSAPAFAVARLAAERCLDDLLPLNQL